MSRVEQVGRRTYTQKWFDNGDGSFDLQAYTGHVHHKNGQGDYVDSDPFTYTDEGQYWEMTEASYHQQVYKKFTAASLITFKNRFEGANHDIKYSPHSLWWVDSTDINNRTKIEDAQSVDGVESADRFLWTDAFGTGIHFEVIKRRTGNQKRIIIDSLSALGTPPSQDHVLMLICQYTGAGLKVKARDNASDWDESSYYESMEGFDIREAVTSKTTYVEPSIVLDAAKRGAKINVFWEYRQGKLWQAKVIPLSFLQDQDVEYPIRADTTTDYDTGTGDGHVGSHESTWDAAHNDTTGDVADYTGTDMDAYARRQNSTNYYIHRCFAPVDTSGIPDAATISSAAYYFYVELKWDDYNDAYSYMSLVGQTSQASNTQLVADDIEECADTHPSPSKSAIQASDDEKDITGISTASWINWALNSQGLGWISKTGYTLLGFRCGADIEDDTKTLNGRDGIEVTSSAGSNTPYLKVTYTDAGPQTISPTGMSSNAAFGTQKLNRSIDPTGMTSQAAFGTQMLKHIINGLTGIPSQAAFGSHQINFTLIMTGMPSQAAFGAHTLVMDQFVTMTTGIPSQAAFGTTKLNLYIVPTGISTNASFGAHQLDLTLILSGLASSAAFGNHTLLMDQFVTMTAGIPSQAAFGTHKLNLYIVCTGLSTSAAFGSPQLNYTILPSGLGSAAAFGAHTVVGGSLEQYRFISPVVTYPCFEKPD